MTEPAKTFDHTMSKSKQKVKGFYKNIDGNDIVIFVAKEPGGKAMNIGDIVASIIPSAQQKINFGIK